MSGAAAFILAFLSLSVLSAVAYADTPVLIISEIMRDPDTVSDSDGEWFEIYYRGNEQIDINGMTIRDEGSDSHTISESVTMQPNSITVLCRNKDSAGNGGVLCTYQYNKFSLGNDDDEIILEKDGELKDSVSYDKTSFPDKAGASMELTDISSDNTVGGNWHTAYLPFGSGDYGTPGSANSALPTPTSEPTATPTKMPTPTKIPTPTKTPAPSKTPTPAKSPSASRTLTSPTRSDSDELSEESEEERTGDVLAQTDRESTPSSGRYYAWGRESVATDEEEFVASPGGDRKNENFSVSKIMFGAAGAGLIGMIASAAWIFRKGRVA